MAALDEVKHLSHRKQRVALLSVIATAALTTLKCAIGIISGSVGVLAEGFHSGSDTVAALIAYFSVRQSSKPPDEDHAYGHGKFESLSGAVEALLIFVAAAYIVYESLKRLTGGAQLSYGTLAMFVMGISAASTWLVSSTLLKVAKESGSIALEADGWHLRTDAYTSVGVFVALALVRLTGLHVWDAIAALFVAALMVRVGVKLLLEAWHQLVDASLPEDEINLIKGLLEAHSSNFVSYHKLRTRRSGTQRYVDLHLVVDGNATVEQIHKLCDHLEKRIREELPNTEVLIHAEPAETKKAESKATREPKDQAMRHLEGLRRRFRWGWKRRRSTESTPASDRMPPEQLGSHRHDAQSM